ncbi:MAG: radical SAM protein [Lachnospiraceae bacterium]|nr:radical SAM protein [Lachnospiraceae bacterium]
MNEPLYDGLSDTGPGSAICVQCPRRCGADRLKTTGFCGVSAGFQLARAAPHFGEEPCISGTNGSGAVFFCGCNLRCVFCQNHEISRGKNGFSVSREELKKILLRLQDEGVHNINLVTPSHYSHELARILREVKLSVPVVWNSSAYETVEQLKELEGLVQIYLPDMKYALPDPARRYSAAADYPEAAAAAIREMFRQTGPFQTDENGLLKSGVLIRHLILPGQIENTLRVIDFVEDSFPKDAVMFSLLSQYTPIEALARAGALDPFPELSRRISPEEYARVSDYLFFSSLESGYVQELSSAEESFIPAFDGWGLFTY